LIVVIETLHEFVFTALKNCKSLHRGERQKPGFGFGLTYLVETKRADLDKLLAAPKHTRIGEFLSVDSSNKIRRLSRKEMQDGKNRRCLRSGPR
jgi:hypothetical protein